jgi:hypothetical protein
MGNARHGTSRTRRADPVNAERHAHKIAAAVDVAWHRGLSRAGRPEVPLGVVATMAIAGLIARPRSGLDGRLRSLSPEEFLSTARHVWSVTLKLRPDLVHLVCPLMGWLFECQDHGTVVRAKDVADAALDAGQLRLTATERRFDADLLGPVLGSLKARTATTANAQIYTPGDVAVALAALAVDEPEPGHSFCDDAVGTGGLLRVAAQVVRAGGADPAAMIWYGADLDELAVAACAVNSLIWGLGPRIVLYVGDTLANADWPDRALQRRASALRTFSDLEKIAKLLQGPDAT